MSGASGSGSDADDDDSDGGRHRSAKQPTSFSKGHKGASFARAFSKVLETKAKPSLASTSGKDVILADSKSLRKRKAEDEAAKQAQRTNKLLKMELRQRGHLSVPKKGENPEHDLREKQLLKLATKGVVLLFNAVAKAQKQKQEAVLTGKKAKLSRASFLAELTKGAAATEAGGLGAGPSSAPGTVLGAAMGAPASSDSQGWKVLKDGFTGFASSGKMKDWDRQAEGDSDDGRDQVSDVDSEGDSDHDNGW